MKYLKPRSRQFILTTENPANDVFTFRSVGWVPTTVTYRKTMTSRNDTGKRSRITPLCY